MHCIQRHSWTATLFALSIAILTLTPAVEAREYTYTVIAETSGPFFDFTGATINDSGTVAFLARLDNDVTGAVVKGDGGPVTTLVTKDGPGGPYHGVDNCIINNSGAVAFSANHKIEGTSVYVLSDGAVRTVVSEDSSGFSLVGLMDFNNAGQVAYYGNKTLDTGFRTVGLYLDGTTLFEDDLDFGPYASLYPPALNDLGATTYVAITRPPTGGNQGNFVLFRNGIKILTGDDSEYLGFWYPSIDLAGNVYAAAKMDDQRMGVLRMGSAPSLLVQTGDPYTSIDLIVAANDAGDVVFKGSAPGIISGLFSGPSPKDDKVVVMGTPLLGSTVFTMDLDRRGLNESGQVAFVARLADGRWAVVRADPVPEADLDGDGLLDDWEKQGGGIDANSDGAIDVSLWDLGADPERKDLFLEMDFVQGQTISNFAAEYLIEAFGNAPVRNPDGTTGIKLHIDRTETNLVAPAVETMTNKWPTGFDDLKAAHFGTPEDRADPNAENILAARKKFVRYCIVYDRTEDMNLAVGRGETPGDDFYVLYGAPYLHDGVNDDDEQASLVMHEFGHNLGLDHGGVRPLNPEQVPGRNWEINGKPNYVSVMNYVLTDPLPWNKEFWSLDYSRTAQMPLIENNLDESVGLTSNGKDNNTLMPFGIDGLCDGVPCRTITFVRLNGEPTDWDNDGTIETGVTQDINYLGPGIPDPDFTTPSPGQTLQGYNDWANLQYAIGTKGHFADRFHGELPDGEPSQTAHEWLEENMPLPPTPCPNLPDRHRLTTWTAGQPAALTVTVRGDGPFTYRWRRNGEPLTDGGPISGSATASLTLTSVQPSDAGVYDVVVTADCGTGASNITEVDVTVPYTMNEAVQALQIASGFLAAAPGDMTRLDVYRVKPSAGVIDLMDVSRVLNSTAR